MLSARTMSEKLLLSGPGRDLRGLAFFVLVPLALAVMTATATGYNRVFGYGGALLYVSLLSLIPWWIGEGTTRIVWRLIRKHRPPLWLVCILGALASCIFVGPYSMAIALLFKTYWPVGDGSAAFGVTAEPHWQHGAIQIARAVFFWTAANYVFDRLLDYPRFRNPELSIRSADDCGLIRRLSHISSLSDIAVVKAEEHYVRVHSADTDEFIAYQFKMALKNLEGEDGFQVHRSYWVRRSAVVAIREEASQLSLELTDGSIVPVSRPHHALIRQVIK